MMQEMMLLWHGASSVNLEDRVSDINLVLNGILPHDCSKFPTHVTRK